MVKYDRFVNAYRYLIMGGTIFCILFQIPFDQYTLCILAALMLFLNMQIRVAVKKENLIHFSILLELGIIIFMASYFSPLSCIFLLITLTDISFKLKTKFAYFLVLLTLAYGFCIKGVNSLEVGMILCLLYGMVLLLLLHLKRELTSKLQAESLYDQFRRNSYELEAARSRIETYSKQVEKITKLEERNRISRELHDSIGHNLTGLLMQVDAARQIMLVDQEKGMTLLHSAYENINRSIESVRYIVQQLRPNEYQTHKNSIKALINSFMESTNVRIVYLTTGIPYELFPSVETVLYRNIQEALTNAVRHGKATEISVHFIFGLNHTEVEIIDNGKGTHTLNKGFGLCGIEERLDMIGGSIEYDLTNGFKLTMSVPKREMSYGN